MADYSEAKVQYDREDRERRQGMSERDLDRPSSSRAVGGVGAQLTFIQEQLQQNDELIKVIEERLSPMLAPEYDEPSQMVKDDSPVRTQSEIAEELQSYGARIGRHNRRLQRLLERINL